MKRIYSHLSAYLVIGLSFIGFAQDLSAEDVLAQMTETAEAVTDASFLLEGELVDPDGTVTILEVDIQIVPEVNAARAEFFQPDALADNFVVLDGEDFYNYIFLTNQASLFNASDPDALGDIFPQAADNEAFEFTFDLNQLFEGWEPEVLSFEEGRYTVRLVNTEQDVNIAYVDATTLEGEWLPETLTFSDVDEEVFMTLEFNEVALDTGLNPDDVIFIPEDAEIIDER